MGCMTAPACLRTVAKIAAAPDGVSFLAKQGCLGRSDGSGRCMVAGYGVQGSGDSWAAARHQWVKGALAAADGMEASA